MTKTIGDVSVTLLILLTVGMLAGSWMISGVVPTLRSARTGLFTPPGITC